MTGTDLRATQAQRTRAAIRAAALTLTRERGYAAMTVDDVAALAGVSRRTVFNHFASKADLLVVGLEPPAPEVVEAFVDGSGSLLEDLGTLLASGAETVESERGWLLSFPEIVRDNPEVERAVHERLRIVAQSLAEAAGSCAWDRTSSRPPPPGRSSTSGSTCATTPPAATAPRSARSPPTRRASTPDGGSIERTGAQGTIRSLYMRGP
ncbi:TetR/AcrR family transcriptional regulator [Actinomyces oris]|uniref:TetR/AcrR family transcriptional regulator n=1 Tax=Actinomyces oris TaxID=544580 RepID=UPI000AF83133|nr:TetR/AcrR family transcriptional regulator [Actinomyces oris]